MGNIGTWQLVIVLVIILLLFGAKRLPEAARGLGRSLRVFKSETQGLMDDRDDTATTDTPRSQESIEQRPATPADRSEPVTDDQPQREA
jgi:sec-independent protein translocase protein TatA